jgi:ubiquinone/menaquinone biosynthesis C-methylase UbiE
LENPPKILEESYRILKPGGEIFIVDWKKMDMPEGPPVTIRCLPEQVEEQLKKAGFSGTQIINGLPKHFLLVAKKER